MKTQILVVFAILANICYGQDSLEIVKGMQGPNTIFVNDLRIVQFKWKSKLANRNDSIKIFSLTPMSKRVEKVNGFALGFGHFENKNVDCQTINGLNIEASPISLLLISFGINVPFEGIFVGINDNIISNTAFFDDDTKTYIKINGLNISSGGFVGGAEMNGLNICIVSGMNKMNGLSLNGAILNTKEFNGVSISGIANLTNYGNGLQMGLSNVSRNHNGIQVGLFNHSKNLRGLQFGLWNTNGKRKLPLVNWQFKN